MNTWLKRTLIGAATVAALAGGVAAYSQGEHHWHGGPSADDIAMHQAAMLEHIGKALELDATQQAKLQALGNQIHASHDKLAGAAGSTHDRFAALVAGATFDRAGAQALVNEKIAAVQAGAPALINAAGDFYDSLRPDQQQKMRDLMAQHHQEMMQRMQQHSTPPAASTN
jgi:Spy/CpxP family protein refolding chaperone